MKSRFNPRSLFNTGPRWAAALLCVAVLAWAGAAGAVITIPPSTQFDVTGFLQEATLDGGGTGALQGGHLKVNGLLITVPANTIVILPANALTWQELFAQAPAPYGPTQTGMALKDLPAPLTTYEVQVIGNRVTGAAGGDQYIAGLVYVSQQGLNVGAGFINFIDYTLGEMRVGGAFGDATTGARVRINDPAGRYGLATTTPDPRFTVDPDNPTIMSGSGYPMCLPRVTPTGSNDATSDPLCPQPNRPLDVTGNPAINITTANVTNTFGGTVTPPPAGTFPDSAQQAPFEIGDYITYSGTLVQDCATCLGGGTTAGPWPVLGTAATWISAHTIINNTAVYTFQGSNPAYIMTEVTIIGTGGLTVLGAGEAAIRTRFEGMTTDFSRSVHLYGIDLDPATGATADRDWGTIGVDPGPAGGLGAVQGRWRFRPPCLAFGSVPTKPQTQCVYGPAGGFLPPTREMRSTIEGLQTQNPALPGAVTAANGLFYGQYHAPILEYIFPENVPGSPIVENNFNAMPFLACGGYSSSAGTVAGVLNPWPSNVPPSGCAPPLQASAGPDQNVHAGVLVTLTGTATGGTPPYTFLWTQTAGTVVTLNTPTAATTTFTAPSVQGVLTFQFQVTDSKGTIVTASTNVNVTSLPVIQHVAPQTVVSGQSFSLAAVCVDPTNAACAITWSQTTTGGGATLGGNPVVLVPNPKTGANQGPFVVNLAVGAPGTTLFFTVVGTSVNGTSLPEFTTVTVNPIADSPVITSAQYRTGKQRLDITVTSNQINPNLQMFLNPYLTEQGTTFDPATLGNIFTNTGGGLYTITLVGAQPPKCNGVLPYATPCSATPLTVHSSAGGISTPQRLDRIRQ